MSDDQVNRAPQGRRPIDMKEPYAVLYWSERLGVMPEQLEDAVKAVGPSAEAVERYLKSGRT